MEMRDLPNSCLGGTKVGQPIGKQRVSAWLYEVVHHTYSFKGWSSFSQGS